MPARVARPSLVAAGSADGARRQGHGGEAAGEPCDAGSRGQIRGVSRGRSQRGVPGTGRTRIGPAALPRGMPWRGKAGRAGARPTGSWRAGLPSLERCRNAWGSRDAVLRGHVFSSETWAAVTQRLPSTSPAAPGEPAPSRGEGMAPPDTWGRLGRAPQSRSRDSDGHVGTGLKGTWPGGQRLVKQQEMTMRCPPLQPPPWGLHPPGAECVVWACYTGLLYS